MKQFLPTSSAAHSLPALLQSFFSRWALPFLLGFGSSFLLSGARLVGQPLPLCIGFSAALGLTPAGVGAILGGSAGYVAFWGIRSALPCVCVMTLVLAAAAIFHGTSLLDLAWFMPVMAGVLTLAVGLADLSDAALPLRVPFLLLRPVLATVSCLLARKRTRSAGQAFLLGAMVCGLSSVGAKLPLNLGVLAAFAVAVGVPQRKRGLYLSAACGIGLDASGCMRMPMTAALFLFRWISASIPWQISFLRYGAIALCAVGAVLFWLVFPMCLPLSACLGCAVGLLRYEAPVKKTTRLPPSQRIAPLCQALEQMAQAVLGASADEVEISSDQLFDHAADRVCKCCTQFRSCWGSSGDKTYQALSHAAPAILVRGKATASDFPPTFSERCRHLSGFTDAVNEELDNLRCQRRYQLRSSEQQVFLSSTLRRLSHLISRTRQPTAVFPARFRVEFYCTSVQKDGFHANGDQCTLLSLPDGLCFLLLTDGMGTGPEAEAESKLAQSLLENLLRGGCPAQEALELLNDFYIQRGSSEFSVVDLVELNLASGDGILYKWGGATSYWKYNTIVKKMGLASPPPGISLQAHTPERYPITLHHGQLLVLTTDGIPTDDTAERISGFVGNSLQALAESLLENARLRTSDDRTVAVLRLHPLRSQEK